MGNTKRELDMDGCLKLAAAIVRLVTRDLKKAYEKEDEQRIKYLERWFTSDHAQILTMGNGEYILAKIKKE